MLKKIEGIVTGKRRDSANQEHLVVKPLSGNNPQDVFVYGAKSKRNGGPAVGDAGTFYVTQGGIERSLNFISWETMSAEAMAKMLKDAKPLEVKEVDTTALPALSDAEKEARRAARRANNASPVTSEANEEQATADSLA